MVSLSVYGFFKCVGMGRKSQSINAKFSASIPLGIQSPLLISYNAKHFISAQNVELCYSPRSI